MTEYIFKTVLITSLTGTLPALLFALVKPITRKCFSSGWHYYAWLVVLISMILPFRFVMPGEADASPGAAVSAKTEQSAYTAHAPLEDSVHSLVPENTKQGISAAGMFNSVKEFAESKMRILSVLWLLGMSILFLVKTAGYMLFLMKLRRHSETTECPEIKQFTDRSISVRRSDIIHSPLMVGIIRPVLLLPRTSMTREQLSNVLAHEMTHFKRKDILYKWFACIVKCIHWFNPVVYYVNRQINTECEISCDLTVIKGMSREEEISYINTILTLLAVNNPKTPAITTGMVSDAKSLKRRFTMIKNKFNISKKAMIISVVSAIVILGGTVFASGILNGKLLGEPAREVLQTSKKEPALKVKADEGGRVTHDAENGDILSAESEPELIPHREESEISSAPRLQAEAESHVSESKTDAPSSYIVLEEISMEESFVRPCQGEISMYFGKREHPITKETNVHNGIDIVAPKGTDVVSSITGVVTEAGFDAERGNYIVVERDNIKTVYSQLATVNVKKGDSISSAQSIGTVGSTGMSTGAHLHFEVMIDGEYRDPQALIE